MTDTKEQAQTYVNKLQKTLPQIFKQAETNKLTQNRATFDTTIQAVIEQIKKREIRQYILKEYKKFGDQLWKR